MFIKKFIGYIIWLFLFPIYTFAQFNIAVVEFQNNTTFTIREEKDTGCDITGKILSTQIGYSISTISYYAKLGDLKIIEDNQINNILLKYKIGKLAFLQKENRRIIKDEVDIDYIIFGEIDDIRISKGFNKIRSNIKIKVYLANLNEDKLGSFISDTHNTIKKGLFKKVDNDKIVSIHLQAVAKNIAEKIISVIMPKPQKSIKKENPLLLYSEGIMEYLKGNCKGAVELFSRMLELSPDNPFALDARRHIERCMKILTATEFGYGFVSYKEGYILATGVGYLPKSKSISKEVRIKLAKEAAIKDAKENLLKTVKNIKINNDIKIEVLYYNNEKVAQKIDRLIDKAEGVEEVFQDNAYYVKLKVYLNGVDGLAGIVLPPPYIIMEY